jgi:hypothetical protein
MRRGGRVKSPPRNVRQPKNDVAVVLARPAHGREAVDNDRIEPNEALALRVSLRLDGHGAERERTGGGGSFRSLQSFCSHPLTAASCALIPFGGDRPLDQRACTARRA